MSTKIFSTNIEVKGAFSANTTAGVGVAASATTSLAVLANLNNPGYQFGISLTGSVVSSSNHSYGIYSIPTIAPPIGKAAIPMYVGGTLATGASNVIDCYGIWSAAQAKTGTGTITNVYGMYLDEQTVGTKNYGIYSNAAKNVLPGIYGGIGAAGSLTISSTTHATKGNITIDSPIVSLPGISGTATAAANLRGNVSLANTAVTAAVTFGTAEADASYYLSVTPVGFGATAALGSNRIVKITKTTGGFTVYFEAAPGTGNTNTFDWILVR